ncbi:MAG: hypothetical protein AB4042_05065 [Leptolyngbyaceae cyanobacterium]
MPDILSLLQCLMFEIDEITLKRLYLVITFGKQRGDEVWYIGHTI